MSVTCPGTAFTNVDFPLVSTGDLYAAASLQRLQTLSHLAPCKFIKTDLQTLNFSAVPN